MAEIRGVLEWLRMHIPLEYHDPQRVYAEVSGILQQNPFIHPRTNIFVHENGLSELLLCIDGLLPIRYRNINYKIPIAIWIPHDYPQSPPMVFVTPKKDMIVKQSRNVDPNGKCYHPNLANWSSDPNNPNYRTSNLQSITQLFQRLFSENPPVRSVVPTHRQSAPPPPLPPRPAGSTSPTNPTSSPPQTPISPRVPPRPPPRPPSLVHQNQLHVDTNGVSRSSSTNSLDQAPSVLKSPPPLPPQPFRNNTPPPIPYKGNLPPSPFRQQFNRPRATSLGPQLSPSTSPPPDILDESLPPVQSSVLPPPPLPPNPEHARLVKHLNHVVQGYIQPSIHQTREQQNEARHEREKLLNVEVQAEKEISELTRLKDASERNILTLKDCIRNAQGVIEWTKNRGEISGDEIVCAQTLVYDQLFNLVAEDLAIEDTMEILAKALDHERISLDVFLKETRKLAREQFLIKALIKKISNSAGIETTGINGTPVVLGAGMTRPLVIGFRWRNLSMYALELGIRRSTIVVRE